jgi:hypothetical protein
MMQKFGNVVATVRRVRNDGLKLGRIANPRPPHTVTVNLFIVNFWKTQLFQIILHSAIAVIRIVDYKVLLLVTTQLLQERENVSV